MKIVLITPGQPAINPRIVKEADTLTKAGHEVTVLYSYWIDWATEADNSIFKNAAWQHQRIGGTKTANKLVYWATRMRFKMANLLNSLVGNNFGMAELAQARCYTELKKEAKKIKADWYIGHNLGALAVAVHAAKYHDAKAGFDFEDYHREENSDMPLHEKRRVVYLEQKYIPQLNYISSSSQLITAKVSLNFPSFKNPVLTLMNCFRVADQPAFRENIPGNELRLCWFSQTVGKNRGLEILIDALQQINDQSIHLTLAGRCNPDMIGYIDQHAGSIRNCIHLAGIIQPNDLPEFAAGFHIGLALETGFSTNNDIALSNKIFTYLLAGNAVILSETSMQDAFNKEYHIGESFKPGDMNGLMEKIMLYKNRDILNKQRAYNHKLAAEQLNWEKESAKLLAIVYK